MPIIPNRCPSDQDPGHLVDAFDPQHYQWIVSGSGGASNGLSRIDVDHRGKLIRPNDMRNFGLHRSPVEARSRGGRLDIPEDIHRYGEGKCLPESENQQRTSLAQPSPRHFQGRQLHDTSIQRPSVSDMASARGSHRSGKKSSGLESRRPSLTITVPASSDAYPAVSFPLLSSQKSSYKSVDSDQRLEGSGVILRGSGSILTSKSSRRAYQAVQNSDGQPVMVNDVGNPGWTEELGVLLSTGEPGYNRALVVDARLNAPDVPTTAFPQSASSFNWN